MAKRSDISRCGIPTAYAGVNFRSRLEARWACFFDNVGWDWAYEPFDLDGYIPDFVLNFKLRPMLAEVKPLLTEEYLKPAREKVDSSSWNDEVLVLGSAFLDDDPYNPIIGALGEVWPEEMPSASRERFWGLIRGFKCRKCNKLTVASVDGYFQCRSNGCYEGDHYLGDSKGAFLDAWLNAGNVVQWRPGR